DECRGALESLWSSWPEASAAPPDALAHASGCPRCRPELDALRALCARAGAAGPWSELLPAERWARLAARTRAALRGAGGPRPRPARLLVPGLAAALLALALLRGLAPRPKAPGLEPPPEAVAKAELLLDLGLLEDWDLVRGPAGRSRP